MSTPGAVFGPGILILTRTDVTPSPAINVGFVQEFSIDAAGTTKQLYGQNQYPLVAARGTIKATGKIKAAVVSGIAWNTAFYGQTSLSTTSIIQWNIGSTFTTSTTSSTVQAGSSLTYESDLGVTYAGTGLPLQRVAAGSEAQGKYSVTSAGLYSFAVADGGPTSTAQNIKITYTNTSTTSSGQVLGVTNQAIGFTPTFQIDYYTNLNQPSAKPYVIRVFSAIGAKHAMAFKLEDFMIPEFDFEFFANASNQVFNVYLPEVA